jgi:Protein of unknown function (DUF3089)
MAGSGVGRRPNAERGHKWARRTLHALVVALAIGVVPVVAVSFSSSISPGPGGASTRSSTIWLCRPGTALDPCIYNRASTSVSARGATSVSPSRGPTRTAKRFDCFYVYPTVSNQKTDNANLVVQRPEIAAAAAQASRFSQVCNVWAPMYRQATNAALSKGLATNRTVVNVAYTSLLSAWRDFLAHDDDGRPIVFIGHSQGAAMLIKLLRSQVDPSPKLRRQLVSAIILGGNVQVPVGRDVGGSFLHIPACSSTSQTGCVIAYSTFPSTPPPPAYFGRPGQGVSLQSGQTARVGQRVLCVNPVMLSNASGELQPYFLTVTAQTKGVTVTTPWVTFPGLYTARCETVGNATWLQVDTASVPGDPRPMVSETLGPLWGYHVSDVNLALGNLVGDVAAQEASFR